MLWFVLFFIPQYFSGHFFVKSALMKFRGQELCDLFPCHGPGSCIILPKMLDSPHLYDSFPSGSTEKFCVCFFSDTDEGVMWKCWLVLAVSFPVFFLWNVIIYRSLSLLYKSTISTSKLVFLRWKQQFQMYINESCTFRHLYRRYRWGLSRTFMSNHRPWGAPAVNYQNKTKSNRN